MKRDQSNAMWHARWQGLRSSGLTMKEFAQREGFRAPSAYRWLRKARHCGLWLDEPKPGKAIAMTKPRGGCGVCARGRERYAGSKLDAAAIGADQRSSRRARDRRCRATLRGARRALASRVIRPTAAAVVYLCVAPTDLRKQAASLALLVEQSLKPIDMFRTEGC
jgi:hypothetical protein